MSDFTGLLSDNVKRISQAFMMAFYLPSVLFVFVHFLILWPAWQNPATPLKDIDLLGLVKTVELPQWIVLFVLPALLGIVLLALNNSIIMIYEGRPTFLKYTILFPSYRCKLTQHQRYYDELATLRTEYRQRSADLTKQSLSQEEKSLLPHLLSGLRQQIHERENQLEQAAKVPQLPLDTARITPTAFGNAYALAEEYAFERYGIDTVLFWPRLRTLMDSHDQPLSERLSQHKTALDMVLNLSFLSVIVLIECLLVVGWQCGTGITPSITLWLLSGLVAAALMVSFYLESVRAMQTLGELIKMSFDFHRRLILDAFHISPPSDLWQEQIVWVRLAAFIRRGHPFYFPSDMTEST